MRSITSQSDKVKKLGASSNFDINASAIMLTYPEAGLTKDEIGKNLRREGGKFISFIVSKEYYSSGKAHYHVFARLPGPKKWTMPVLDRIGGIHGHYQRVDRTHGRVIAYLMKDNDFVYYPPTLKEEMEQAVCNYAMQGFGMEGSKFARVYAHQKIHGEDKLAGNNFQDPQKKVKGPPNKKIVKRDLFKKMAKSCIKQEGEEKPVFLSVDLIE